jgi:hypothetical protein
MLDHIFTDAIGALRDVLERALLERQAFEERFQVDVLLGDVTWETSYGLPGEGLPPRVQADITLEWSTWSQTTYREWYLTEDLDEPPRITVEIVLRLQRLTAAPDPAMILDVLPVESPTIGGDTLVRSTPTLETIYESDLSEPRFAFEVSYEGEYELDEAALADGSVLDERLGTLGGWISSTLVRLGDLDLGYHPPDEDE